MFSVNFLSPKLEKLKIFLLANNRKKFTLKNESNNLQENKQTKKERLIPTEILYLIQKNCLM